MYVCLSAVSRRFPLHLYLQHRNISHLYYFEKYARIFPYTYLPHSSITFLIRGRKYVVHANLQSVLQEAKGAVLEESNTSQSFGKPHEPLI